MYFLQPALLKKRIKTQFRIKLWTSYITHGNFPRQISLDLCILHFKKSMLFFKLVLGQERRWIIYGHTKMALLKKHLKVLLGISKNERFIYSGVVLYLIKWWKCSTDVKMETFLLRRHVSEIFRVLDDRIWMATFFQYSNSIEIFHYFHRDAFYPFLVKFMRLIAKL